MKAVLQGRRVHMGSHFFGRTWSNGDVVGCMINMEDKSMIFTLNGEILITNKGSELCFADFETEDGKYTIVTIEKVFSFPVYFTGPIREWPKGKLQILIIRKHFE